MKENSIEDRIEEKYLNRETDTLELTIEEAIFILETDESFHYVEDLLQEAYKVILSDYKRVLKENEEWQRAYQEEKDKQFDLIIENKELKEYIAIAPNLDEMTAIKYINIQRDAYTQGRAEEQQKAEQIIYENYISKQKIKDKIEKLNDESHAEELEDIMNRKNYTITELVQYVLQELLEKEK